MSAYPTREVVTYNATANNAAGKMAKKKTDPALDLAANRRGIQSVEVGVALLRALQDSPGPSTLTVLSEMARMPASQAHRYLASYVRAGLVRQNPENRRYELGPLALSLGLAALGQLDLIALASEAAQDVTQNTGLPTLLCVWSDRGAVIIRWNRGVQPVITSLALGSVLPPLSTATGQVFLAYLPRTATAEAVRAEQRLRQRNAAPALSGESIDDRIRRVRNQGAAWVDGGFIPGLRAFACPVLDYQSEAAAAITLVSSVEPIADPKHPAARVLVQRCSKTSEQAGALTLSAPRKID